MTDPPRLSELPEGDPARSLFGSLRDMPPPADLQARTLAGLGLLPPPAGPPPSPPAGSPPAPPVVDPSGISLLPTALLKPIATGIALLSLAGGAAHVALSPSRPAVTASPSPSARPRAAAVTSASQPPALDGASATGGEATSATGTSATEVSPLAAIAAPVTPSSAALAPSPAVVTASAASGEPARVAALAPPDLPGPAPSPERRPTSARQTSSAAVAVPASEAADAPRAPAEELPSPLTAPVATPAAPVRPRLDLDRELVALDLARTSLAAGSPARALEAIAAYRAAFPAGQLGAEALLIEIEARMRTGDRATAVQLAQTFLARHPRSVLAARVRSLAGLPATEANP